MSLSEGAEGERGSLAEWGRFRPGLEALPPGLLPSGCVYAIRCAKVGDDYVKVGSVQGDRLRENLRRDVYAGQTQYIFLIDAVLHVAAETACHGALGATGLAHPAHRDCFRLAPDEIFNRCADVIKRANREALVALARRVLQDTTTPAQKRRRRERRERAEHREDTILRVVNHLLPPASGDLPHAEVEGPR